MKAKTRIENRYEDVEIPSVRQLLWLLLWCSIWEKVLPWTCYELILLNKYGCFASVLEIEDREGLNLKVRYIVSQKVVSFSFKKYSTYKMRIPIDAICALVSWDIFIDSMCFCFIK